MTAEQIVAVASFVVSVLLLILPGIAGWWDALAGDLKARYAIAMCFGLALLVTALSCFGIDLGVGATCPELTINTVLKVVYSLFTTALLAAGTIQTLYHYGLKPGKDFVVALFADKG